MATEIASNSDAAVPGRSADSIASAKITSAVDAAQQIVAGIEKGSYRMVIGSDARMLDRLSRLAPQRATDMIAKKMASLLGSCPASRSRVDGESTGSARSVDKSALMGLA